MDVDEASSVATEKRAFAHVGGDTTFAKSDELVVSLYASLPVELKQTLRNAGMHLIHHVN